MGFFGGETISTVDPKIGSFRVQSSIYGLVIPIIYGKVRLAANLIWFSDFKAIAHTETQGGKGGGGYSHTKFTYYCALMLGICEGPVADICRLWRGKDVYALPMPSGGWDPEESPIPGLVLTPDMRRIVDKGTILGKVTTSACKFFYGTYPQAVWDHLISHTYKKGGHTFLKHAGQDICYPGLCMVASSNYLLESGANLPNHNFEIQSLITFAGVIATIPKEPHTIGGTIKDVTEYYVVPSSPYQITVVHSEANFCSDVAVIDISDPGNPVSFTKVGGSPGQGQYSVDSGGTFTFNSLDAGRPVSIEYKYADDPNPRIAVLRQKYFAADKGVTLDDTARTPFIRITGGNPAPMEYDLEGHPTIPTPTHLWNFRNNYKDESQYEPLQLTPFGTGNAFGPDSLGREKDALVLNGSGYASWDTYRESLHNLGESWSILVEFKASNFTPGGTTVYVLGGYYRVIIYYIPTDDTLKAIIFSNGVWIYLPSFPSPANGTNYQIILTAGGGLACWYINGVKVGGDIALDSIDPAGTILKFALGASHIGAYRLSGSIYRGAVWKGTKLTAAQVTDICNKWDDFIGGTYLFNKIDSGKKVLISYDHQVANDANPKDIITDLLTNIHYGVGFPEDRITGLSDYSNYCVANGLLLSPALTEQKPAQEWLAYLLHLTNSAVIWSEGKLKVIPYGDTEAHGYGVTYTPNLTPFYDLDDNDFVCEKDEDPIKITRSAPADAVNHVRLEYYNRRKDYNVAIAEAKDQAAIEMYGLCSGDVIEAHAVCEPPIARKVAQLFLQRGLYVRNDYEFRIGWRYCLLEPMDLVTITDVKLGLDKTPVRILEIEEDDEGTLTVKAEEFPLGIAEVTLYPDQDHLGYQEFYNQPPEPCNNPVIIEVPYQLFENIGDSAAGVIQPEVWVAVSGQPDTPGDEEVAWAGVDVYASFDDETYDYLGRIEGGSRHGSLAAALSLPALGIGGAPVADEVNTLQVDLSLSRGQIYSVSEAAAARIRPSLCYVDGEFLAYRTATLTAQYKYSLTHLWRWAWAWEKKTSDPDGQVHPIGSKFARLDMNLVKLRYSPEAIGRTIYFKLLPFNQYGGGQPGLADVDPYTYKLRGLALREPLPDVETFREVFRDKAYHLTWAAVTDYFLPVEYEIRKGDDWDSGHIVARVKETQLVVKGAGFYWIKAKSAVSGLPVAYSANAVGLNIEASAIVDNVVEEWDEKACGWCIEGADLMVVDPEGNLQLDGVMPFQNIAHVELEPDILHPGGVAPLGSLFIEVCRSTIFGSDKKCFCFPEYKVEARLYPGLVEEAPDFAALPDLNPANLNQYIKVDIRLGVFNQISGYREFDFISAYYMGSSFAPLIYAQSFNKHVTPVITKMKWTVDMPDIVDKGINISIPAAGLSISFTKIFQIAPAVQVTILAAQAGDYAVITNATATGFTVQILNGQVGVARTINWLAQGY